MDTQSGKIYDADEYAKLHAIAKAKCVMISKDTLTEKQLADMQVSLNDTETPAAKKRIKTYNNLRNKPCVCGSGRKFKKCCWSKMRTAQGRLG